MKLVLIALVVVLASVAILAQMSAPARVQQEQFTVIGIEARTSNAKEMSSSGIIGKQWQKFVQERTLQKIPHKADKSIYAVYSDYTSDRNGEYSFVIGARVSDSSAIPAGMVLKTVPAGTYVMISTDRGPVAKVVSAAWQRIWTLEDKGSLGGKRAYRADFEVYGQRAADPQNSEVDVYVGLK